ncbi:MAG: hypothetical protein IJ542_02850 [Clostridia bacterium]|nr:hypothetical protein [Clostridia bacterium]
MNQTKSHIKKILKKLSEGFEYSEEVEEYVKEEGELVLAKKKITKKFVPPDMLAIKMLLDFNENGGKLSQMTDQELINLKNSLLEKLKGEENDSAITIQ